MPVTDDIESAENSGGSGYQGSGHSESCNENVDNDTCDCGADSEED